MDLRFKIIRRGFCGRKRSSQLSFDLLCPFSASIRILPRTVNYSLLSYFFPSCAAPIHTRRISLIIVYYKSPHSLGLTAQRGRAFLSRSSRTGGAFASRLTERNSISAHFQTREKLAASAISPRSHARRI